MDEKTMSPSGKPISIAAEPESSGPVAQARQRVVYVRLVEENPVRIDDQLRILETYLREHGCFGPEEVRSRAAGTVFVDDGVGGFTNPADRPGFGSLMEHCGSHSCALDEPGLVLVTRKDRIARDPVLVEQARAALEVFGWRVHIASGPAQEYHGQAEFPANAVLAAFEAYEEQCRKARRRAARSIRRQSERGHS